MSKLKTLCPSDSKSYAGRGYTPMALPPSPERSRSRVQAELDPVHMPSSKPLLRAFSNSQQFLVNSQHENLCEYALVIFPKMFKDWANVKISQSSKFQGVIFTFGIADLQQFPRDSNDKDPGNHMGPMGFDLGWSTHLFETRYVSEMRQVMCMRMLQMNPP